MVKPDLSRPFDHIKQSAVLAGLLSAQCEPKYVHAIAKEMIFAEAFHYMQNIEPGDRVLWERGMRLSSPLSGLLFVLGLTRALKPVLAK